jgi:hypothetical protein
MAGTLKVTAYVDVSGPLADGTADRALERWEQNTSQALADEGTAMLRAFPMNKTGRAHGGFQARLHAVRRDRATVEIPGPMITGVTWAPWLEGTSKRNQSTGFGGYHLFRKTRLDLDKKATDIGERELREVMAAIGGDG